MPASFFAFSIFSLVQEGFLVGVVFALTAAIPIMKFGNRTGEAAAERSFALGCQRGSLVADFPPVSPATAPTPSRLTISNKLQAGNPAEEQRA